MVPWKSFPKHYNGNYYFSWVVPTAKWERSNKHCCKQLSPDCAWRSLEEQAGAHTLLSVILSTLFLHGGEVNWSSVDSPADRVPEYSHFLKNRKTLVQWQRTGLQLCFKKHKHPQELQAWCKDATSGIASPKGSVGQPMPRSATTEMKYFNLDPPGSKAMWTYYLSSACIAKQQNVMSL